VSEWAAKKTSSVFWPIERAAARLLRSWEDAVSLIGKSLGHYRVVEKVGEGGMGVVYRATDSRLRRDVALKILPDAFADDTDRMVQFEHEAHVLASLNHPNIAAIYGLEEADQGRALVLEFVEGATLAEHIRAGAMSVEEILRIALQITDALAAAHEKGIVHRDLKPANVKITPEGRAKILDFGLAEAVKPVQEPSEVDEITRDSVVKMPAVAGTLPYMAPEQLRDEALDARTDVYALGVLLYEVATGQRPFFGSEGAKLIGDIQHTPPTPPRVLNKAVPLWLERLILKCLKKEPDRRYASMKSVSEALQSAETAPETAGKSLAVLYFENLSRADEDVYFCDGITEDIIIELSRIRDLTVFSRSAVLPFSNRRLSAVEVGQKLDAAYVLDGSLRRAGSRVRITTQLVETSTSRSLWAERYDRQLEDIFAIQDEIAQSIARALRLMLSEAEKQAIAKPPTSNVKAYECYLRGRQHFRQFRRKSIEVATSMIAKAIEIDPDYAAAHAALADCYAYLYMFWEASDENLSEAEKASRKAVELDPELAEAHVARGVAVSLGKRYEEADQFFETAIRLDPKLFEAYYFYARGHYARGKLEQAVYWFARASEARPEDYQAPTLAGSALAGLGRKKESDAAYRESLELAQKHLEVHPGDARALYFSAIALCQLGERQEQAVEWAERALAMDPDEPQVLYNVGCAFALLGRTDESLSCLAKTIEHGDWWKIWMKNDPDLVCLHDDPRFEALVKPA
jgi:non-specific serine/threonine protein kinase